MKRRDFIALSGGAAISVNWPLAARAQRGRLRRVGALMLGIADAESFRSELRAGLRVSGFLEGRDILFDFRSADEMIDRLPALAAELVALQADVIVALYTPCGLAAQKATRTIPIVLVTGDPVGTGLVSSLSRPGGNITGISFMSADLYGKHVELFRDILPSIRRIAALGNEADPISKPFLAQIELAGRTTGIEIEPAIMVRGINEIDRAFGAMKTVGAEAVIVQGSLGSRHTAELALRHRLPAASHARSFAEVGGLFSYGAELTHIFHRAAMFVSKILRGAKPAEMPVEQPTKFALIVNLKSAKALGIPIGETFLARADTVIE